ncbi:NfeD family protein [Deinococcus aquiradiocola]|uniref:NfeD-like C-terminal domain-containing protein n=1 Tax=Deinococcus aquiradiocola TaxID=393059 RepID=A0A917UPM0_9DEIO|nr:hypothetical protein [Deinococcus aquiradiocola]GGJ72490.1 hypothetical protein GCM10008939_16150 [Deinococcus aquiradiocola]
MSMVFTVCALVGCGLLLLSLLGDHSSSLHDLAGHPEVAPPGGHAFGGSLLSWFSLRSVVSFVAFFGLGGLLAAWLALRPELQLVFALVAGAAVGGFTAFVFRLAEVRGELTARTTPLVGRTAQVIVAPHGAVPGKVLLTAGGQSEQMLARSSDDLTPGDQVLVISQAGGLLDVKRWDAR